MSTLAQSEGIEAPAAGTWAIDPGHADVGFVGRHFGLTKIRGRFTGVSGVVEIAEDLTASSVVVEHRHDVGELGRSGP